VHGGWGWDFLRAALSKDVHGFTRDRLPERELVNGYFREELAEHTRIDHRARNTVLAKRAGLLEHRDTQIGEGLAGRLLHQLRQRNSTGQTGGAGAYDHHIHFERFIARRILADQSVEW